MTPELKTCRKCLVAQGQDNFHANRAQCKRCVRAAAAKHKRLKHAANPDVARASYRKDCQRRRKVNRDGTCRWRLSYYYGLTLEFYNDCLVKQENRCLGCGKEFTSARTPRVDHDHLSGEFRGLLCSACNLTLGLIKDQPETLRRLAGYVHDNR